MWLISRWLQKLRVIANYFCKCPFQSNKRQTGTHNTSQQDPLTITTAALYPRPLALSQLEEFVHIQIFDIDIESSSVGLGSTPRLKVLGSISYIHPQYVISI